MRGHGHPRALRGVTRVPCSGLHYRQVALAGELFQRGVGSRQVALAVRVSSGCAKVAGSIPGQPDSYHNQLMSA